MRWPIPRGGERRHVWCFQQQLRWFEWLSRIVEHLTNLTNFFIESFVFSTCQFLFFLFYQFTMVVMSEHQVTPSDKFCQFALNYCIPSLEINSEVISSVESSVRNARRTGGKRSPAPLRAIPHSAPTPVGSPKFANMNSVVPATA